MESSDKYKELESNNGKCKSVFHQSGGMVCEKTIEIVELKSKLKAKDELLRDMSERLANIIAHGLELETSEEVSKEYVVSCIDFLNKPEIKQLRGEEC